MPIGRGCALGSRAQPPLGTVSCEAWDEGGIWEPGKAVEKEGSSEPSLPPCSGQCPLWERVREAVLSPLGDLHRRALGGGGQKALPPCVRGAPEPHGPPGRDGDLTSLTAYSSSCSACSPDFRLGSQRKSSFIFWVVSEASLPLLFLKAARLFSQRCGPTLYTRRQRTRVASCPASLPPRLLHFPPCWRICCR